MNRLSGRRRDGWREHLWLVPFAYGALLWLAGLRWIAAGLHFDTATYAAAAGTSWDALITALPPASLRVVTLLVRELGGNLGVLAGALTMLLAGFGLRRRERWAWAALWLLPLHAGLDLATLAAHSAVTPAALAWDVGLMATTTLSLIRLWPRSQSQSRE